MSTALKRASDEPEARTLTGEVKGTIGPHTFETSAGKFRIFKDRFEVTLIDRHDDGGSEEVRLTFPRKDATGTSLPLSASGTNAEAWISFKNPTAPYAIKYTTATLRIDKLVESPFELKGSLGQDEGNPDAEHRVDITFDVTT